MITALGLVLYDDDHYSSQDYDIDYDIISTTSEDSLPKKRKKTMKEKGETLVELPRKMVKARKCPTYVYYPSDAFHLRDMLLSKSRSRPLTEEDFGHDSNRTELKLSGRKKCATFSPWFLGKGRFRERLENSDFDISDIIVSANRFLEKDYFSEKEVNFLIQYFCKTPVESSKCLTALIELEQNFFQTFSN